MSNACRRAEVLAGAIALGEAHTTERDEYRRHLAACIPCLHAFGGEREIERVMATVDAAREAETWQPAVRFLQRRRRNVLTALAQLAVPVTVAAVAVLFTEHRPVVPHHTNVIARAPNVVTHVPRHHAVVVHAPRPIPEFAAAQMIVVHNVVTLKPPVVTAEGAARPPAPAVYVFKSTTVVAHAHTKARSPKSDIPIWRRDVSSGPRVAAVAPPTAQPAQITGRAESIAIAPLPIVRDVVPLGGDTAINPEPPMIAYREGAEGTTAFEVSVDERGMPVKCTITKSSGYLVLDETVCKAAMKARFSPRVVNGRAIPGVYRDAFTFRNPNPNEGF